MFFSSSLCLKLDYLFFYKITLGQYNLAKFTLVDAIDSFAVIEQFQ